MISLMPTLIISRFISPLLPLRMVQDLDGTLKKMETEFTALAKLNSHFEMGDPDIDGKAKLLGKFQKQPLYIYIPPK